jgi:hypothetical protein
MKNNGYKWLIAALILGSLLGWITSEYKNAYFSTPMNVPIENAQTKSQPRVQKKPTPSVPPQPTKTPIKTVKKVEPEIPMVYVCLGRYSKKFHWRRDCPGLRGCKGGVKRVTLSRAKYIGRRLCGFED